MKKYFIKSIVILSLLFAFNSCNDKDEDPLEDLISFTWWVSPPLIDFNIPDKIVTQNSYLAFKDLSQGFVSHKWTISEGTNFIDTNTSESDTNYLDDIIPEAGLETEESLIAVVFPEVGTFQITLTNTYDQEVSGAVQVDNEWVAEQVFMITVE